MSVHTTRFATNNFVALTKQILREQRAYIEEYWNWLELDFPLEVGSPKRWMVESKEQLWDDFVKHTPITRFCFSIYQTTFNKLWFDFDGENALEAVKQFAKYLMKKGYEHMLISSGKGFHVYVKTTKLQMMDCASPRKTLYNAQYTLLKEAGVLTYHDHQILGDIRRLAPFPFSYNPKRHKFVVPVIPTSQLRAGKELAFHPLRETVRRKGKFDIHKFKDCTEADIPMNDVDVDIPYLSTDVNLKVNEDGLPPCVQAAFQDIEMNGKKMGDWRGRWNATAWMVWAGYSDDEINALARKYWSKCPRTDIWRNNYVHWYRFKVLEQVKKNNYSPISCARMKAEGRCPKTCQYSEVFKK